MYSDYLGDVDCWDYWKDVPIYALLSMATYFVGW
jgi:hypothetical protein